LPQVSEQDLVHIHRGLGEINNKGIAAWGLFNKTGVHLADGAMTGTVYHEAFHLSFWMLNNKTNRISILNDAKKIWGNLDN